MTDDQLEALRAQLGAATRRAEEAEARLARDDLRAGADFLELATDELQRSERILRAIFGGATDAMLLVDDEGRFVDANPAACRLLKSTKAVILRRGIGDFGVGTPEESLKNFGKLRAEGALLVRSHVRNSLGEQRTVDVSAVANIGSGLHLIVLRDVTDEHAAAQSLAWTEEELRRTDARFRAMVEKSAEAIALLSAEGKVLYITRHAVEFFGATPAEMLGNDAFAWVAPADRKRVSVAMSGGATTGSQVEFRILEKSGGERWLEAVITNLLDDPAIAAIVLNIRDVTARRIEMRERERLIESLTFERRRLGNLLETAPAFMAVLRGEDLVFELANDAFIALVGRRNILGRPYREAIPEAEEQRFIELLHSVLHTLRPFSAKGQRVLIARNGRDLEPFFVNFIVKPLVETDGAVSGVFIHGVNVTEETVAQQRMRDQFNGVPVPIYAWQRVVVDGEVDFVLRDFNNAALLRARGALAAVAGKGMRELYPEDPSFLADAIRCLDKGETFQREAERVSMGFTEKRRTLLTYSPAPPDVVLVHSEDITDRRKLEDQLRQAHKMEAVGRLAGGVAHDFNNLLSVVLSYTSLALEELPEGDPIRDDLEQVKHAGNRAVELTRQLLAFSRQQVLQPRSMSVRDTVLGLEKMLRRLLGEDIELSFDMKSRGQVEADPGQMEQVIMNLVINARDAMPEGGHITIVTSDVAHGEELLTEPTSTATGPMVCLCVSDTGSGMDDATRAQIFEPFFTTKGAGKGTGLGLATVFGIVQQSGGTISVQSHQANEAEGKAGSGTTFRIYLPRAARGGEVFSAAPKAATVRGGNETILVVEDEAPLRALTVTVLRRAGYDVLEASDGAEAIGVAAECAKPIHLLLTDVVMPRMNGRSLADRLAFTRPKTKTLFMSGYTDDATVLQRVLASRVAFLQKPLTPDTLLRKIREVLDE